MKNGKNEKLINSFLFGNFFIFILNTLLRSKIVWYALITNKTNNVREGAPKHNTMYLRR